MNDSYLVISLLVLVVLMLTSDYYTYLLKQNKEEFNVTVNNRRGRRYGHPYNYNYGHRYGYGYNYSYPYYYYPYYYMSPWWWY